MAVCTRRRREMLGHLLRSWRALDVPEDVQLRFLVVENDSEPRSADLVQSILGEQAEYILEPSLGIPFARNRAMRAARAMGGTHLGFVDDDEYCPPDWLVKMWAVARDHDLTGGPQRIAAAEDRLNRWNQSALTLLQQRADKRACERARLAAQGDLEAVDLYTHNWMLDLRAAEARDLWFDEGLRYSGGSDTMFSIMATRAGLSKGWASDAFVEDRWPNRRLTAKYLFSRVSAQTAQNYRRNPLPSKRPIKKLPNVLMRVLTLPFGLLVQGPRALMRLAMKAGAMHGLWKARRGEGNRHYAPEAEAFHVDG
nr:glycosyltransferase family A protein [Actibacterium ureilyticum]